MQFEIGAEQPNPESVIAHIAEQTGRSHEYISKRVHLGLHILAHSHEQDEEVQRIMLMHGVPIPETPEESSRTITLNIPTAEEESAQEEKKKREAAEHKAKLEEVYFPVRERLGRFVAEGLSGDELEDLLKELDNLAGIVVRRMETSDELLTWFSTNGNENLWGRSPLELLISGDEHQLNTLTMAALNFNRPEGSYRLEMSDNFASSLRKFGRDAS